jgi:NADH-quinone oxidoreductase subunit G
LIRVLGEKLSLPGFDAITCADVTGDIAALCEGAEKPSGEVATVSIAAPAKPADRPEAIVEIPLYATDSIVRRGEALQATPQKDKDSVYLNQATARQLGLKIGGQAVIKGDGAETVMTVVVDENVGDGGYLLYAAHPGATAFSGAAQIQISKA